MPSGLVRALHLSLGKILTEGLEDRWQRHTRVARFFRQGLENLGLRFVACGEYQSPTVTAVWAPQTLSAERLIQQLKEKHEIAIAGGLDELQGKIVRVGHMGPTAKLHAVVPVLLGIEEALRDAGARIAVGQSLQGLEVS
jgi:aspartate aminotransferase-like enzyme